MNQFYLKIFLGEGPINPPVFWHNVENEKM